MSYSTPPNNSTPGQFYQQDPYNNLTTQSYQQQFQLKRNTLMPSSWNKPEEQHKKQMAYNSWDANRNDTDWYKYTPTEDGVMRYISSQGSSRLQQNTRNPLNRILGTPNMLRSPPPAPLKTNTTVLFGDSSARLDLINPPQSRAHSYTQHW
jgi:hypothetical protein